MKTLAELESQIDGHFLKVGEALNEIKSRLLYKEDYGSWVKYCEERWGLKANRCDHWINAWITAQSLVDCEKVPEKEIYYRDLGTSGLNPELQRQAWLESIDYAKERGFDTPSPELVRQKIQWIQRGLSEPCVTGETVRVTSGPGAGLEGPVVGTDCGGAVIMVRGEKDGELVDFPALPAEIERLHVVRRKKFSFKKKPTIHQELDLYRGIVRDTLLDISVPLEVRESIRAKLRAFNDSLSQLEAEPCDFEAMDTAA